MLGVIKLLHFFEMSTFNVGHFSFGLDIFRSFEKWQTPPLRISPFKKILMGNHFQIHFLVSILCSFSRPDIYSNQNLGNEIDFQLLIISIEIVTNNINGSKSIFTNKMCAWVDISSNMSGYQLQISDLF